MKLISVVVPFYNEEPMADHYFEKLFEVLNPLKNKYSFEVVSVNDGSKDRTLEILLENQKKHNEIRVVNLTRNFGHESAVCAGLSSAKGDAIIPMDADLQDPPEVIVSLLEKFEEGYEVVNAKRRARDTDTFLKKKTASMFYKFISKLSKKVKIPEDVGHFRLISRRALDEVLALGEVTRVFRVEVPFVGFKTTEVEFVRPSREFGETHYNYKNMFELASDSITSTTVVPLRFSLIPTFLFGGLTFLSLITMLVFDFLFWCNVGPLGEFELMIWLIANIIGIFGSAIFVTLTIMSEYLAKTFKEAQHRPVFLIDKIYEPRKEE